MKERAVVKYKSRRILILGGILFWAGLLAFGVWRSVDSQKREIGRIVLFQVANLTKLNEGAVKIQALFEELNASNSGNKNNTEGNRIVSLDDYPTVIIQRKLTEELFTGRQLISQIRKTDGLIKSKSTGRFAKFIPTNNPIEKTEINMDKLDKFYNTLSGLSDRGIRLTALIFNFGVAMQMAQAKPDETAIKLLQNVTTDFENMAAIEKQTDLTGLPEDLEVLYQKIIAQDEKLVKDLQGVKTNMKTFGIDAAASETAGQEDILKFWQNDQTVSVIGQLAKDWQGFAAGL